jgi:hypothetical protein
MTLASNFKVFTTPLKDRITSGKRSKRDGFHLFRQWEPLTSRVDHRHLFQSKIFQGDMDRRSDSGLVFSLTFDPEQIISPTKDDVDFGALVGLPRKNARHMVQHAIPVR